MLLTTQSSHSPYSETQFLLAIAASRRTESYAPPMFQLQPDTRAKQLHRPAKAQARRPRILVSTAIGGCAKYGGPYGSVRGTPLRMQNDHFDLDDAEEMDVSAVEDALERREETDVSRGSSPSDLLMKDLRKVEIITRILRRLGGPDVWEEASNPMPGDIQRSVPQTSMSP